MSERAPAFYVATNAILIRGDEVLLQKRENTGFLDGFWSMPSGHMEGKETVIESTIRETKEEIGVILDEKSLELKHVSHRISTGRVYIDFYLVSKKWLGEINNVEPDKHSEVKWFKLNNLPEKIIPYIKRVLEKIQNNIYFSEEKS